jgi:hypothetical protein
MSARPASRVSFAAGTYPTVPRLPPADSNQPFVGVRPENWLKFMGTTVPAIVNNGQMVVMLEGIHGEPWICDTPDSQGGPPAVPTSAVILATPRTQIHCVGLDPDADVFNGQSPTIGPSISVLHTNVPGAVPPTVDLVSSPGAVGSSFLLANSDAGIAQIYNIQSITPIVGGVTITVDRPILRQYNAASATAQAVSSVLQDVHLIGNGALITGSAAQYFRLRGAVRCVIAGWRTNLSLGFPTQAVGTFDVAGRENLFLDMNIVQNGVPGLEVASNEFTTVERSDIQGATLGVVDIDSTSTAITDCSGTQCGSAVALVSFTGGSPGLQAGCIGDTITNCSAYSCPIGFDIRAASQSTSLVGCVARFNTEGMLLRNAPDPTQPVSDTMITDCTVTNNLTIGVRIDGTTQRTSFANHTTGGNANPPAGGTDISASADFTIDGYKSHLVDTGLLIGVNVNAYIKNALVQQDVPGSGGFCVFTEPTAGSNVVIDGLTYVCNNAGGAVIAFGQGSGSRWELDNITITGTHAANALLVLMAGGDVSRIGDNIILNGAQIFVGVGGFLNRSFAAVAPVTVPAGGTHVVNFPLRTTEDPEIIQVTTTATAGPVVVSVRTPGTSFTLANQGAVDAVVNYVVR